MTSTKINPVNQEIDDHFSEQYGKANFLSMFSIDESNWSKMVAGDRKMPKFLKILMNRDKRIIQLDKAFQRVSPNIDTNQLFELLEASERGDTAEMKIRLDKYESAIRILENVPKMIEKALIKAEEAKQ